MLLFLSAGCMLPYFRVHAAGGGAQHLAGIAFSAGAMAVDGATGLTLALDVSAGALHADRLPCTSAEGALGNSYGAALGVGYAPVRTARTVIAFCAQAALWGYEFREAGVHAYASSAGTELRRDAELSALLFAFGAGARCTRQLGGSVCFFANVGAYYALGAETCEYTASTSAKTRDESEGHALRGSAAITPALGLCVRL